MAQREARASNLELLRIVGMLLIVGDHATGQSGVLAFDSYGQSLAFCLLGAGSRLACDVFVLVGAWFLCAQPFRTRRLAGLWLSLFLYTVPVTLVCLAAGQPVSAGELRWALFPASTRQLWFVSDYLLLLLVSPLLARALQGLPRAGHRAALLALAVPLVAYPTLFGQDGIVGETAWAFLYLYLLAAYLRRWPDNRLARLFRRRAVALAMGLGLPLAVTAARAYLEWQGQTGGKAMQYVAYYRTGLLALPNLLAAVALFYLFQSLPLGSRPRLNRLAGATLGVYILHQVPALRAVLWNGIFHAEAHQGSVGYALFMVLATYAACTAIDLLRTKLVMQPLQSTQAFQRLCTKGDALAAQIEKTA